MTDTNWPNQSQPQPPQAPQPKPKKPIYKRVWFWLLVIVALLLAFGAMGGGDDGSDAKTDTAASSEAKSTDKAAKKADEKKAEDAKPTERLVLEKGYKFTTDDFSPMVKGTVTNNSDKPVKVAVMITFNAYDDSGANVGTCTDSTESIDANGKWKFRALCDTDDVAKVKFKDLSGF